MEEHKSFQMASIQPTTNDGRKWWQFTKFSRRELGQTAIIGVLAGGILYHNVELLERAFGVSGLVAGYVFGELFSGIGLASALSWLYKVIRRQK